MSGGGTVIDFSRMKTTGIIELFRYHMLVHVFQIVSRAWGQKQLQNWAESSCRAALYLVQQRMGMHVLPPNKWESFNLI